MQLTYSNSIQYYQYWFIALNVSLNIDKITLLTYSYFTLLIWDLYFRDLTLYFTALFEINEI